MEDGTPTGEEAQRAFIAEVLDWEEKYQAPMTQEARTAIWELTQQSGNPSREVAEQAFHRVATALHGGCCTNRRLSGGVKPRSCVKDGRPDGVGAPETSGVTGILGLAEGP
jgi:hypothetical protein